MVTKTLAFRLAVKDDEQVKKRLRDLGVSGQRSLEKIERSGLRASRGLQAIDRASSRVGATMGLLARRILLLAGPAALALLTKRALNNADAIAKQADAIGISTKALQEYQFAARLSGVETESLTKGFSILAGRIGEARQRVSSELSSGLKELNPQLLEAFKNVSTLEGALDLAFTAMAEMANQTDRVALARLLFGRAGVAFTNIVRDGTGALQAMRDEAAALGLILSDELLRGAEKTTDQLERFSSVISIKVNKALLNMTPLLDDAVDALLALSEVGKKLGLGFEGFSDLTGRSIERLNLDLGRSQKRIAELNRDILTLEQSALGRLRPELTRLPQLNKLLREEERLRGQIQARIAFLGAPAPPAAGGFPTTTDGPATAAGERQAFIDRIDRAVTRAASEREAALRAIDRFRVDLLQSAGDVVGVIDARRAASLKEVEKLLAQNRILEAEAAQARVDINKAADLEITKSRTASFAAIMARGQTVFAATRTAAELYAIEIAKLTKLLNEGAISQDTFNRAVGAAKKELDEASEAAGGLKDAGREMGEVIGTAFEDALIAGANFRDLLSALEQDLLRIAQRKLVTEPLQKFFGGLLEDVFSPVNTDPGVFDPAASFFDFAKGGVVGRDTGHRRRVPLSAFANAQHFEHGGIAGLRPDEVPIIAHRGERISPAGRATGGINITNNWNIRTPDAGGFNASRGQIMATFSRSLEVATGRNR